MVKSKTEWTGASVADFIAAVPDDRRREDAKTLVAMLEALTGEPPRMWGPTIVGFGAYHYRYDSGREGDAPLAGFSPRAKELVVYLTCEGERSAALLQRLGKHRATTSCLYIKSLADVDRQVLSDLVRDSIETTRAKYPAS
jgi:hypothetical protein